MACIGSAIQPQKRTFNFVAAVGGASANLFGGQAVWQMAGADDLNPVGKDEQADDETCGRGSHMLAFIKPENAVKPCAKRVSAHSCVVLSSGRVCPPAASHIKRSRCAAG